MQPKKKKILFIITKSNFGGAQRYVYELATGLPTEQYEVVVAFGGSGILKEKLEVAHIRTVSLHTLERDVRVTQEFHAFRELYHLIEKEQPDVVHLNSSKVGGSGAFIARLCGVKNIIFTAHGWPFYEDRSFMWRAIVWFFSYLTTLLSHRVIVVSQHDFVQAHMPGLRRKIIHIPTAIGTVPFLPKDVARDFLAEHTHTTITSDTLLVGSIGEYVKNKNLLIAIKAIENVHAHTAQKILYILIGNDGDERTMLEEYIREHNLLGTVILAGFVDNARNYLKAFDLFLMPSLKEGLPYGLLEAGVAGLPVIASNVGGIPDIIEHGVTGYLINPRTPDTLIDGLNEFIENPTKTHEWAHTLHTRVTTTFRIDTMRAHTYALYLK